MQWWRRRDAENARRTFRLKRELLEAKFFTLASSLGKPRGVRWLDCKWHDEVIFARDRQTGLITAFVGVSLSFEAIEIDSTFGNAHGITRIAHSVVTLHLVDEAGHPTRAALERVLAFLRERL